MIPTLTNWRSRLRGDPAAWLLDYAGNPSVYFWFQRDVVGRPEDAAALVRARELILFSAPVQALFAAQNASGYWDNPDALDAPRYRATLWQLALLAELGVPRNSRRARAACEFILQNFLRDDGELTGVTDEAAAGLLLRTLVYFNGHADPRLLRAIDALATRVPACTPGAAVFAVWTLADLLNHRPTSKALEALAQGEEIILDALARGAFSTFGAFPSFDETDALLALRVLAQRSRAGDPRAGGVIEKIWEKQEENARWGLDKTLNEIVRLDASDASKWATLNVLRVVTKL